MLRLLTRDAEADAMIEPKKRRRRRVTAPKRVLQDYIQELFAERARINAELREVKKIYFADEKLEEIRSGRLQAAG